MDKPDVENAVIETADDYFDLIDAIDEYYRILEHGKKVAEGGIKIKDE